MNALRLLVLACAAMAVSSQNQTCPQATILVLLDMSENVREAATNFTRFDILQGQMRTFLANRFLANTANNISMAIYGYHSNGVFYIVPEWTPIAQARSVVSNITTMNEGGSWTYVAFENITRSPPVANNILVLISSQGSASANRTNMAITQANRVQALGWKITVTAVQGPNEINMAELTAINNGQPPTIVTDSTNMKGYLQLAADLERIPGLLGCKDPEPTAEQLCSQCLYDAGSYYAAHPRYCDAFIFCKSSPPTMLACGAGTFFDNGKCNFIDKVKCPVGECTTSTPTNTLYASYRCCNQYFECKGGANILRQCPDDQVFNDATKVCQTISDPESPCGEVGRHVCDVKPKEPVDPQPITCSLDCEMDVSGDPCYFRCYNQLRRLPAGTIWSKAACSLLASDACKESNDTTTKDLSLDCTAPFLVTFNGGGRDVFNQRTESFINVYSTTQEVIFANNSAVYTSAMKNPYVYFFYMANADFGVNVAFRFRFKLPNPKIGVTYDLLSNNYCAECPETISFTAAATSATDRSVSVQFKTTAGIVFVKADISLSNADAWLEMVVVYGDTVVSGVLKELAQDATTVIKSSQFTTFTKPAGSTIETNRCGVQLGRGPNTHLDGSIDEFAVYRFCQNITSVAN